MRIMTTNIWGDYFNNPVLVREQNIYRVYEEYKPDVIGLQEITPGWYASNLFPWLMKDYFMVGTELTESNNYVPMAISKKYALVAKGYEPFADTPDTSKGVTWAVVKDKESQKVFGVCNVHFWWRQGETAHDTLRAKNAQQLTEVMKYILGRFQCPVFALGDMNCVRTSQVFRVVYAINGVAALIDMTEDKDTVCTIHGDPLADSEGYYHGEKTVLDQTASIDHIMAMGSGFKVLQYRVIEDQYALDATDHSPVFADVELL